MLALVSHQLQNHTYDSSFSFFIECFVIYFLHYILCIRTYKLKVTLEMHVYILCIRTYKLKVTLEMHLSKNQL